MFKRLKRSWSALKQGTPGSRFEAQFNHQRKGQGGSFGRALRMIAGVILLAVGLFFLPAPGPGFIIVALGAVLLARESRIAARTLDHVEVRGRTVATWARRRWRQLNDARRAARR